MGDNVYLGDRDGVRTPMQWSSDRNGGFSRANPQKLYLPTIIDPEYHYEAINVEAQQSNPSSLLWWMKRLLAKRKEHRLFGRGSIEFMSGDNPRVLAFVREYEGEAVLVLANLSRFVQAARLNLEQLKGAVPTELFGRMTFPEIADTPYFISLGPYDFYWLQLVRGQPLETAAERPPLRARTTWSAVLAPARRKELASVVLSYVMQRRWFRSKARKRKHVTISDVISFEGPHRFAIVLLLVEYDHGPAEKYVVPLAFAEDSDPAESMRTPSLVIARVEVTDVPERGTVGGVLYDALCSEAFNTKLMNAMTRGLRGTGEHGWMSGDAFAALRELEPDATLLPRLTAADQSNSGIVYGDRYILKLFRVIEEGPNAELEMSRYLATHDPSYHGVPRIAGALEYTQQGREPSTLGTLFQFVSNQGDAWQLATDSLSRFFDRVLADAKRPEVPPEEPGSLLERARRPLSDKVVDWIGPFIDRVRLLGVRTAELHLQVVAAPAEDPLFVPEPFDIMHQQSMYGSAIAHTARTFDVVRAHLRDMSPEIRAVAEQVLAREGDLDRVFSRLTKRRVDGIRARAHGDYHLGQVLWTGEDFKIIDFEGEPGRPLSQRRVKRNPLRDVAGMLRSFRYASASALRSSQRPEDIARMDAWAHAWTHWVSAAFLSGYLEKAQGSRLVPRTDADLALLLEFFLLEKCVYEIGYEINNRPDWVEIPLRGLLELMAATA